MSGTLISPPTKKRFYEKVCFNFDYPISSPLLPHKAVDKEEKRMQLEISALYYNRHK
jgi:hypothetical protein